MDFEWNEAKSDKNLRDRGFDFAFASRLFEGPVIEARGLRAAYGEERIVALGLIDGALYCVVYTDRDDVRRIISARPASRKEREQWPL